MREIAATDFVLARAPMPLGENEIHLWFFPAPAARIKIDHALQLRALLAVYLRCPATALQIERKAHGKPFLSEPHGTVLQFNLAHSADAMIIALARKQALGVDIESTARARPWIELAQRYFTAAEGQALAALPGDRLGAAFVRLWSCKEAVLKALGRGIAFGLERLDFALDHDGAVAGLRSITAEAGAAPDWQLLRLEPAAGLCGALAWRGGSMRVCSFRAEA